jgi:hypothetical protein
MTDYNDGKWHGWNGGECPVDPEAHVDIVWINRVGGLDRNDFVYARHCSWVHGDDGDIHDGDIIAFRVVKPAEPTDPLADLAARVEKLEAIINAIVPQRGGE